MSKEKTLPVGFVMDENIAAEIEENLEDGKLSCARAHAIAKHFQVSPTLIGHTVDTLGIRFYKCQLGLFGYPNKKGWEDAGMPQMTIPDDFTQNLREAATENDTISCLRLWEIAAEHSVPRMQAGYIAETLGINIINCQLGAF